MNTFLYKKMPYDVLNDFAPISLMAQTGNVLTVHPSLPARSVLPNVPTIAEAGLPEYEFAGWHELFAPKGTPAATVALLSDNVKKISAGSHAAARRNSAPTSSEA